MATTKTTWWDKNGDAHEGYIKDGNTFIDEAGTARVPVGATVQTNGGTYKMTSSGGVPTMATARNQYQQNSNAAINAYQAEGKVQEERINAATNAAIAEYNRQKQEAENNREQANREAQMAYLAAANPYGAMGEQMAKMGLSDSGYSETAKLRLASDYAGQISANVRDLNKQLQNIDIQIAQAKASGQYELANMLEARAQTVMQQKVAMENNLSSLDMQAISQAESARQFAENMAYQREQAEEAKAAEERNNKYNLAVTFLQNGMTPDFVSEALGIPREDVASFAASVNAQRAAELAAKRSSGSGGSGSKKIDSAYISAIVKRIQDSGLNTEEWLKDYGSAYKLTDDEIRAIEALVGEGEEQSTSSSAYTRVINVIGGMKRRGKGSPEEITRYVNSLKPGELTEEELDRIIDTYGL